MSHHEGLVSGQRRQFTKMLLQKELRKGVWFGRSVFCELLPGANLYIKNLPQRSSRLKQLLQHFWQS